MFDTLSELVTGGASAPAAVRRPVFTVTHTAAAPAGGGGVGGLAGGGLGGLADAASGAGLGAVAGALGLGGGGAADPWAQHLVSLSVDTGLAPFVGVAELWVAAVEGAPTVGVGDKVALGLGYADSGRPPVFSGLVSAVRRGVGHPTRITVTDGGADLARRRLNRSYEKQAAGDIVRDLASQAAVLTDTVEPGGDFPFYVVDDRAGLYAQIARLAQFCGFVAAVTPEGKLRFAPLPTGSGPAQTFRYGEDVLSLSARSAASEPGKLTVVGEGASGKQGGEAWAWLLKDPATVKAAAGNGATERWRSEGALRAPGLVSTAAGDGGSRAGACATVGTLLVPGAPEVTPGALFGIEGVPDAALNGSFVARRVLHRLDKRRGFLTEIGFSQQSASGGAAGGLLGDALGALGGFL